MKQHSTALKLLIALFLLLITTMAAFAFSPASLGGASRSPRDDAQPFTVAGQLRQCSQYADETGSFVGSSTILSKKNPALVDVYYVTSTGGWTYYGEYAIQEGSNSLQFMGSNRQYAYEIYYCPSTTTAACVNGEFRAVTDKSYQVCSNGQWGTTTQCALNTYYDPTAKSCKLPFTCQEQWTCSAWGQCTADGKQYRTCRDVNACATSKDMPVTAQFCNTIPTTGTTTDQIRQNIQLVGQPRLDAYEGTTGTARTVTQTVTVKVAGSYWLEAGLENTKKPLSIGSSIEKNTCNPEETWYANQQVSLTSGVQNVTFKVTPTADGQYVLHTAIVTACAGEVVQQMNAVDHLFIGNKDNGTAKPAVLSWFTGTGSVLILIGIGMIVVIALIVGVTKRRK